jgi:Cu2+-exporting ATPase
VIRQNLVWALSYNIVALPLAFTGYVTPLVAAFGMAVSSLIVVINATRLAFRQQFSRPEGAA